jgi:DNA-binding NtrC family response regulator
MPPGRRRVLLVDDEPQLRSTLERILSFRGFEVEPADSAEAAQAAIARGGIDLLLTDVSLGGAMDGFQLAFWARDRLPRLPMVLISGLALSAPPPALQNDAAVWMLPKPFSAHDLIATLHNALQATNDGTA